MTFLCRTIFSWMWFKRHKAPEITNLYFQFIHEIISKKIIHLIPLGIEEGKCGESFAEAAKTICCDLKKKLYCFTTCNKWFMKRPVGERYRYKKHCRSKSYSRKMVLNTSFAKESWTRISSIKQFNGKIWLSLQLHFQEQNYYIKQPVVNLYLFHFYCWQIISLLN